MNANQEIITELRRVLGERDAAREQLDLTKRELGRWVDRETQAVRECDELRAQRGLALARLENAIQLANQYAEERDDARSTIEDLNDEIARGREAIRIYRTETEAAKRERDQARMAEERARESLEELDEAIYDCLPWDDDDSPLDCVEHAADRLRDLVKERDEARAEVERLRAEAAPMNEHFTAGYRDGYRDAYRRGAEAMRLACQQWCRAWENDGEAIADALADLQVEEP